MNYLNWKFLFNKAKSNCIKQGYIVEHVSAKTESGNENVLVLKRKDIKGKIIFDSTPKMLEKLAYENISEITLRRPQDKKKGLKLFTPYKKQLQNCLRVTKSRKLKRKIQAKINGLS
jgi:hypothetical protein